MDIDYTLYMSKRLSPDYKIHWRILKDQNEIEVVMQVNGTSWVGLGWRPRTLTATCKNFPAIGVQEAGVGKAYIYWGMINYVILMIVLQTFSSCSWANIWTWAIIRSWAIICPWTSIRRRAVICCRTSIRSWAVIYPWTSVSSWASSRTSDWNQNETSSWTYYSKGSDS